MNNFNMSGDSHTGFVLRSQLSVYHHDMIGARNLFDVSI